MGEDHLQRFAQTVVELQQKQQDRLDDETVNKVARELGMSDADIQKAREESRSAKVRAEALRRSGAIDEAINQLEIGFGFNPLDIEMQYMLADALYRRAQRDKSQNDWARAKDLCIRVIEVAPANKDAPMLLNAINNNDPSKKPDLGIPIGIVVGAAAFVLLAAGVALHFLVGLF
ncbi:MAG TPA: hypothetical protein VGO62_15725 [Myxococcota bacterium]|jgi:tetratricopeptide (TPR) repeat protein